LNVAGQFLELPFGLGSMFGSRTHYIAGRIGGRLLEI